MQVIIVNTLVPVPHFAEHSPVTTLVNSPTR